MDQKTTKISHKKGVLKDERRAFLKKAGGFAIMGLFGMSFFTSCTEEEPQPTSSSPSNNTNDGDNDDGINIDGSQITIDLDIVSELSSSGGWILISSAQVLVVNDGSIKALTSICTHSGCDNNWSLSDGNFNCSCHGSKFTTDGDVVSGPANQALEQFDVAVTDNIITITK